ncbi:regulating synaptic membrane exocytosis protein 2-like [Genypterus blacodes]|uniref:regulating synaptic membrane exocytosis protein 2-like n=1 Tax=Genypterus blacodes TaxID=154954 RepID=UPI003F770ACD
MDGHGWDRGSWHGETASMSMQPVTWQRSQDGEHLIGRILLNKRMKDGTVPADAGALLGFKVVGGKMTETGRLCAFITKVKRGSLADTVGHLRPGDQVLEWNSRILQGATFNEVYNIILESKAEPQVQLLVSRPIGDISRTMEGSQLTSSSSSFDTQKVTPSVSVLRDPPQLLSSPLSLSLSLSPFLFLFLFLCRRPIRRVSVANSLDFPDRYFNNHASWPNHMMNGSCEDYSQDFIPDFPYEADAFDDELLRAVPQSGSTQTSPSGSPIYSQLGRQLPSVPHKNRYGEETFQVLATPTAGAPLSLSPIHQQFPPQVIQQPPPLIRIQAPPLPKPTQSCPTSFSPAAVPRSASVPVCAPPTVPVPVCALPPAPRSITAPPPVPASAMSPALVASIAPPPVPAPALPPAPVPTTAPPPVPAPALPPAPVPTTAPPPVPALPPAPVPTTAPPPVPALPPAPVPTTATSPSPVPAPALPPAPLRTTAPPPVPALPPAPVPTTAPPPVPAPVLPPAPVPNIAPTPVLAPARHLAPVPTTTPPANPAPTLPSPVQQPQPSAEPSPPPAPALKPPPAPSTNLAPSPAPPLQTPEPERRSVTPGGSRKEVTWEDQQKKNCNPANGVMMRDQSKSPDSDVSDSPAILSSDTHQACKISGAETLAGQSVESVGASSEGTQEATGAGEGTATLQKSESLEAEGEEEKPEPSKPAPMQKSASVGGEICSLGRNDDDDDDKKRRSSFGAKMMGIVGLGKKSQSTSQLNPEEEEKKKKVVRLPVQRSVETGLAVDFKARFTRQPSRDPDAEDPIPGALIFPGVKLASDKHFTGFLDGLGPAQLAGRQTLATPHMGDIQIGMVHRKERLDVEVIRARGLVGKQGNKNTPAPYVKVYLMDNGKCVLKRRTRLARKTLDPLYQQQLQFEENPEGKVLQIIVWGDYGRMDHKSFMGAAQILLDDLDLSNMVIGWFKLFPPTSLVDPALAPLTNKETEGSKS